MLGGLIFIVMIAIFGYIFIGVKGSREVPKPDKNGEIKCTINSASEQPGKGYITMIKKTNGNYRFEGKNVDQSKEYQFEHLYWNGFYTFEQQVIPDKTTTKTKHGITRAVVGGAVAGPLGAVVGASTAKKESTIKKGVTTTIRTPMQAYLELTDTSSLKLHRVEFTIAKEAELTKIETAFVIKHEVEQEIKEETKSELSDLRELKHLVDDGIITQAEFDAKKKQLLNL